MRENGTMRVTSEMVEVYRSGQMALDMRAIGEIIEQMVGED